MAAATWAQRWTASDDDERRLDDELDDDGARTTTSEAAESVTVEITGLSLYTHHGVSEAEREVGQRLVLDLRLDVGETDATVTDRSRTRSTTPRSASSSR